jgi:8-oxo-dGTP pyrophosphatase MutT (NUDIX family)
MSHTIQQMDEPDELLDLVDEHDTVIDTIRRQEILNLETDQRGYARAVGVFLINGSGQICVPRRGEHKKIAPGGLDFTASEHVGHGESYDQAAVRGLEEEADVQVSSDELEFVGVVPPFQGIPYFHHIYLYHTDQTPPDHPDYSGYEWLGANELLDRLQSGESAKEILLPSVQLVIDHFKSGES